MIGVFDTFKEAKDSAKAENRRMRPSYLRELKINIIGNFPISSSAKQFNTYDPTKISIVCDEDRVYFSTLNKGTMDNSLFVDWTLSKEAICTCKNCLKKRAYRRNDKNKGKPLDENTWECIIPRLLSDPVLCLNRINLYNEKGVGLFPMFMYVEDWNDFLEIFPDVLGHTLENDFSGDWESGERGFSTDTGIEYFSTGVERSFGNNFKIKLCLTRKNRPVFRIISCFNSEREEQSYRRENRSNYTNDLQNREKILTIKEALSMYSKLKEITKAYKRLLCGASLIYLKMDEEKMSIDRDEDFSIIE